MIGIVDQDLGDRVRRSRAARALVEAKEREDELPQRQVPEAEDREAGQAGVRLLQERLGDLPANGRAMSAAIVVVQKSEANAGPHHRLRVFPPAR